MSLIFEIAVGILIGAALLKLPTTLRRRIAKNLYLKMDVAEILEHFGRTDVYTNQQRSLLLSLAAAQNTEDKKKIATQLSHSFSEK